MKPVDAAVVRRAPALRGYLVHLGGLAVVSAVLIVAQASLLAAAIAPVVVSDAGLGQQSHVLLALAGVLAARVLIGWLGARAGVRASVKVRAELRSVLLAGALRRGPAWLANEKPGELAVAATSGLDALDGYVTRYLPQLVLATVLPVVLLARVAVADLTAATILAVTLPLIPVFMVLIGYSAQAKMQSQWVLLGRLSGHFLDIVEGLPTLRVFGRAKAQVEAVRRVTDRYRRETLATLRIAFLSALVLELLATLSVALVAVSIGLRLVQGHLDLATALLVLLLAPEIYLPLRAVGMAFHASADGLESATRAVSVAADADNVAAITGAGEPATMATTATAAGKPAEPPAVSLHHVQFTYPGRTVPALDDVSLTISPGEMLALTGRSGAGKSTLFSVLLGFVRPDVGDVEVGGHSVPGGDSVSDGDSVSRERPATAWVPQQPRLPGRTVAEVLRLGDPRAGDAQLRDALADVGADFVASLDDEVGSDGTRFSTGQRRRLALARALLHVRAGARLLLLDEPSEGLDPAAEAGVAELLEHLRGTATVLLVTHSTALARLADRRVELSPAGARPTAGPRAVVQA
ncbi:MAG TPA: thiol reductant ABC exporter subunit CydD [Frankiaceae bacterium]|nr:thiol reductant ABC exporter subunit CydD [Frankiaceae bacterium]